MKVLVHTDPDGQEAYGIWWVAEDGVLRNVYLDSEGPFAARGRVLIYNKANPDVPWEEWFNQMTTRFPMFENWVIYDSMGMSPSQFLHALNPLPPIAAAG